MLFNSYLFIFLFLPITLLIYFILNRTRMIVAAKSWLILCSLFFYSYWNVVYLPIILCSILFNYSIGNTLGKRRGTASFRKNVLCLGVAANLLLLGYFKYADFFVWNIHVFFHMKITQLHLLLPLAISFFTFTQITYLIDSYRHQTKENDFLNYVLFVTFFPHLIAGPIVHHRDLMPQFDVLRNKVFSYKNIAIGIFIFSIGLFKKVILADSLAVWAVDGFDHASSLNFIQSWITSLSYSFQLYFDFSGYIDMAIGSSVMFNIQLPINFNSPYQACNIREFWRRWHITLTRFLRDYIYIPLGGNQQGAKNTYRNIMITFLLGGLWHGASWTFIFWGFLHGLAMIIYRISNKWNLRIHPFLSWLITFNFVNATWVFFRARTWQDAVKVLKGMLGLSGIVLPDFFASKLVFLSRFQIRFGDLFWEIKILSLIGLLFFIVLLFKNSNQVAKKFKPNWVNAAFAWFLISISLMGMSQVSEFLYFNF